MAPSENSLDTRGVALVVIAAPHPSTLSRPIRRCLKRQVVDLLQEGFTSEQLDAQPAVVVGDW